MSGRITQKRLETYLKLSGRDEALRDLFRAGNFLFPLTSEYWLEYLDPRHHERKVVVDAYQDYLKTAAGHSTLPEFFAYFLPSGEDKKLIYGAPETEVVRSTSNQLLTSTGDVIDTTRLKGKKPGYAAIVIGPDLKVYIHPHIKNRFHHSSFLAGKPVLFAGMVKVVDGKVVDVDNYTGHYATTADRLNFARDYLSDFAPEKGLKSSRLSRGWRLGNKFRENIIATSMGIPQLLMRVGVSTTTVPAALKMPLPRLKQTNIEDKIAAAKLAITEYQKSPNKSDNVLVGRLEQAIFYAETLINQTFISKRLKEVMLYKYFNKTISSIVGCHIRLHNSELGRILWRSLILANTDMHQRRLPTARGIDVSAGAPAVSTPMRDAADIPTSTGSDAAFDWTDADAV